MRKFLIKGGFYFLIIYLSNLGLGMGLKTLGPRFSESAYGQVKWEDFEALPPQSLDILFVGSSHFLSAIDPAIVDSVSGMNSYNMARVGLRPASAYILLNKVLRNQRPKYLVLDIFHRTFIGSGYNHLYDLGYAFNGEEKVAFALENFSVEENARLFFPTYLYRSNFPKLRPLLGLRSNKDNWRELHYKGYIRHPETIRVSSLRENEFLNYHFDDNQIDQTSLDYLSKLVKLCEDEQIEIIWVSTPLPDICIQGIQNQDEINAYFTLLADQFEIPYLNYNDQPYRDRLSLSDLTDYSDDDHLNISGAEKISVAIAQSIAGKTWMVAEGSKK